MIDFLFPTLSIKKPMMPAPQNSPNNTFDEEMMAEKVNTHNL